MQQALSEEDLSTARGRATAHARVALILSKVPNAEEATTLAAQASRQLGVDSTQLWIEAQQLQRARMTQSRFQRPAAGATPVPAGWPMPSLAERDLLLLLLRVDEARAALLPTVEDVDVAHLGLRAILATLRHSPETPAEALMHQLPGDAERSLLAALLVDEREWTDTAPPDRGARPPLRHPPAEEDASPRDPVHRRCPGYRRARPDPARGEADPPPAGRASRERPHGSPRAGRARARAGHSTLNLTEETHQAWLTNRSWRSWTSSSRWASRRASSPTMR